MSLPGRAADVTWTNGNGTYGTAGNWNPSATPTASDRAIFGDSAAIASYAVGINANATVADVLFNAATKGGFWRASNFVWSVTNSFILDQSSTATAVATIRSGTVAVTNSSGLATFKVGNNSTGNKGLFRLEQQAATDKPTLIVDALQVSTNSTFTLRSGALKVLHGSTIDRGANTTLDTIGDTSGQVADWMMLGGSNSIIYSGAVGVTRLGFAAGSGANVVVAGSGTVWDLTSGTQLSVGHNGKASLTVSNGASMTAKIVSMGVNGAASSNNLIQVSDSGSRMDMNGNFTIGSASIQNQVIITNGGTLVVTNGFTTLGNAAAAVNNGMTVSGSGSLFQDADLLQVGAASASNSLFITAGGVVRSGSGTAASRLGRDAASVDNSALIDGSGSLWEVTGVNGFTVGSSGARNALTLQNSGTMRVIGGAMIVGANASATNSTVTLANGNLVVTNTTGAAILDVRRGTLTLNGGAVRADRLLVTNGASSVFAFNSGTLNVRNSTITNGSLFVVGDGVSAAALNLLGATETNTFANGLNLATNSFLTGSGVIVGNVTNMGTIAPGNSPGILNIEGDLTLTPNSVLNMELAGTNSSLIDQINVTGTIFADGTLRVLLSGYTPAVDDSFDVLDFASISGVFAALDLPTLDVGLSWDTSNLYTLGSLSVIPEPSAYGLLALGGFLIAAWKRRLNVSIR